MSARGDQNSSLETTSTPHPVHVIDDIRTHGVTMGSWLYEIVLSSHPPHVEPLNEIPSTATLPLRGSGRFTVGCYSRNQIHRYKVMA